MNDNLRQNPKRAPNFNVLCFCTVILLGLAIRLLAWNNTLIVNPDGALYINQAKAIYYGQKEFLSCANDHAVNYPAMIAGVYAIVGNWIYAARFLSLLFGTATLVPFYFLLRRYFDVEISALCALLFAMLPVSVGSSVDVIRDPVCWFFLTCGLYFFTIGCEKNSPIPLLYSSISMLLAAWFRTEACIFLIVSLIYLVFFQQNERLKKFISFVLPVVFLTSLLFLYLVAVKKTALQDHLDPNVMVSTFKSIYALYEQNIEELKALSLLHREETLGYLLSEVRMNIWLIPIGVLINRFLETLLYIFAFVFVIGLGGIINQAQKNTSLCYFLLILILTISLLYLHVIHTWWLDYRHIYIFLIPSFVIIGHGFGKILQYIQAKFGLRRISTVCTFTLFIVLSTLPKNLVVRDANNATFKYIGEFIAHREGDETLVSISTPTNIHRWISFYAHLSYQGAVCPEPQETNCWELNVGNYDQFVQHLKEQRIKYLVWTQKQWPEDRIPFAPLPILLNLKELGRWNHPITGQVILFEAG